MTGTEPNPIWHYFIDAEGHLWHEGAEFDDPDTLRLFMKNMAELPAGEGHPQGAWKEHWRVFCQGEECRIAAEDVPYVIQHVEVRPDEVRLQFPGGYEERLDPATLFVGRGNVLYAKVRGGTFTARFNRTSYLDLARVIEHDPKRNVFYLTVDKRRYPIQGVAA